MEVLLCTGIMGEWKWYRDGGHSTAITEVHARVVGVVCVCVSVCVRNLHRTTLFFEAHYLKLHVHV